MRCCRARAEPIVIGDNVWLGGGVIVCAGVTVGDNTVLAVGNPARVIRKLDR
jgi:maltose O-acetyltransferase